ncbi:MAG: hypothetical protein Q9167_004562 [Letrouitia subvulpina]
MKNYIAALSLLFTAAATAAASASQWKGQSHGHPDCPPISGDLTVNLRNIYPEGVDFFPPNCKIYVGSLDNNTLIEFDPYTSTTTAIISFPGISHNKEYLVCGIDYSPATQTLYISANARAPWWNPGSDSMGWNLTGPNRLIHYSPLNDSVLWIADVDPLVDATERSLGALIGGFQDVAEDQAGNAYYAVSWSNIIFKIDVQGRASRFYMPTAREMDTRTYGFGGWFVSGDDVLVLSDGVTHRFARFDLSDQEQGTNPVEPEWHAPTNHPEGYATALWCDSLVALKGFGEKIALCADVFDAMISSHGIIAVYYSKDGWRSSEYIGAVPVDFEQAPGAWSTATFEAVGRSYALMSALPYELGRFPEVKNTPLVDITDQISRLLEERETRGVGSSVDALQYPLEM